MLDCLTRFQSQIGCGLLIFQSPTIPKPFHSHFQLHRNRFFLRSSSSSSPSPTLPVSSTDYLLNSVGLSPKLANEIRSIELKSTSNADAVRALFRGYGFGDAHLATIFSVYPELLSHDPVSTLKPKLDFFARNCGSHLVGVLTRDPNILRKNLSKTIIPCLDFLRSFFGRGSPHAISSLLSSNRGPLILRRFSPVTARNVEALRSFGFPDANVLNFMVLRPQVLSRSSDAFLQLLRDVADMGFDPQAMMFIHGLGIFSKLKKERWVSKLEVIKRSFRWSDEQVLALFVRQPCFMTLSEKRLEEGLDLFLNRMNWTPDDIAKYPNLLNFSFDNRILPRLPVLEILVSRGLRKKTCMGWAFQASEHVFFKEFVERYQQQIPELLQVYRQNIPDSSDS